MSRIAFSRRYLRFGLRTLFVLLTLFCVLLGYGASWSRQRNAFLAEQRARGAEKLRERFAFVRQRRTDVRSFAEVPLVLVGEPLYQALEIMIPREEAKIRTDSSGPGLLDILNTQRDYARAKKLFPESKISPFTYIASPPNGPITISVRDATTNEVISGIVELPPLAYPKMIND
jgi:hypothetical protein